MSTKPFPVVRNKRPRKIKVGEHVIIPRGARETIAEVVEDRGMIGVGGRQLIRIRIHAGTEMERVYEVPAEEVRVVT